MKNIFRLLAAAAIAAMTVGCDLTLYPEDAESPEVYFKSEAHFEQWTNYLYAGLLDSPDAVSRYNADDMVDKSMGNIIQGQRPDYREGPHTNSLSTARSAPLT